MRRASVLERDYRMTRLRGFRSSSSSCSRVIVAIPPCCRLGRRRRPRIRVSSRIRFSSLVSLRLSFACLYSWVVQSSVVQSSSGSLIGSGERFLGGGHFGCHAQVCAGMAPLSGMAPGNSFHSYSYVKHPWACSGQANGGLPSSPPGARAKNMRLHRRAQVSKMPPKGGFQGCFLRVKTVKNARPSRRAGLTRWLAVRRKNIFISPDFFGVGFS